ncbi:hypothetical protein DY000_02030939 [Brassica cretica]|uniref:Uncharacterized protein n=1 Tax=Brassica cretica TaxID=69181 RepID=A0ABQ7DD68_BRACR|nr:hypothetical protein DY000_02030939 [Brassica cretica]
MEGSPYRKFSFSRRKGAVPGTGPGFSPYCSILSSNSGITCALKSTGVAHSQQASLRQDIAPVILRSRVSVRPEPYSEPGGGPVPLFQTGTAEPGGLMFPEEELKGLMRGNRSGGRCPFG